MKLKRINVINYFLSKSKLKRYLEIGIAGGSTFRAVKANKVYGVDPIEPNESTKSALSENVKYYKETSDSFFTNIKKGDVNFGIDVAFIDGLHHWEQTVKDFENCLKFMPKTGIIIMHDCNPTTKEMQIVPRKQSVWTGNVWKAFVYLRSKHKELDMCVYDFDYGIGIAKYGEPKNDINFTKKEVTNMTYEFLDKNRKQLLNLKSPVELEKIIY